MMRRRAAVAGCLLAGLATSGIAAASPSAAATPANAPGVALTGCSGSGTSLSPKGVVVQSATAPNPPSSQGRPLLVDPKGTVSYNGRSSVVIRNHSWSIKVDGLTVKSGSSPNASGKTVNRGTVKVKDYLPFKITGTFYVSGSVTGSGASCSGSMWVKVTGSPAGTVPWFAGIAFAVVGVGGLFFSRPTFPRLKVTS
jgi:hypothetical protein